MFLFLARRGPPGPNHLKTLNQERSQEVSTGPRLRGFILGSGDGYQGVGDRNGSAGMGGDGRRAVRMHREGMDS